MTTSKWPLWGLERPKEPNMLQYSWFWKNFQRYSVLKIISKPTVSGGNMGHERADSQLSLLPLQDFAGHPTPPRLTHNYCSQISYTCLVCLNQRLNLIVLWELLKLWWQNSLARRPSASGLLAYHSRHYPFRVAFHCRGNDIYAGASPHPCFKWSTILKRNINLTSAHVS